MKIGNYELESPLINAGGVVKTIEDVRMMANTGVGAVLLGSYTLDSRIGNAPNGETVYYHDPITGITYNSLGMPNKGIKNIAKDIPQMIKIAHDLGKPAVLNIAPVTGNPALEVAAMFEELSKAGITELDAVELNTGCPNVVMDDGSRHELLSHHPDQLVDVLGELHDISANELKIQSLMVRISPFRDKSDAVNLVAALKQVPVDAVSAFNTFPGGKPLNEYGEPILQVPSNVGGQSGRGMQSKAEEQTVWLMQERDKSGQDFDVIGSNGIYDGASFKQRMDLGVMAVSLTTIFYESTNWASSIDRILSEYSQII